MFLIKSFTFSPIQENTYVLYAPSGNCLIIDPGCYFEDEKEQLANFIHSNNLKPIALLNTHCHLDHVFGNKFIAEKYGLTLQLHPLEKKLLEYAPATGLMYDLPFDNYQGPFHLLEDGDQVALDEDELKVIHVPGHSPGSICFYSVAQDTLMGGDVLFYRSIGRTDLPGGNGPQLIDGIHTRLFTLPDKTIVYPGHGPVTTIGEEKKENPFL